MNGLRTRAGYIHVIHSRVSWFFLEAFWLKVLDTLSAECAFNSTANQKIGQSPLND